MLTEMVLPKRRGVEMRISWARLSQPFRSSTAWCARANAPAGSVLKKTREQLRMKLSWNMRWWKLRCQPRPSSASSACRHSCIRAKPSLPCAPPVFRCRNACTGFRGRALCADCAAASACTAS
jgi:hypothetical protein